ncbi:unnamed protein product [Microthlaspi erraticum]|uniref:FBD domain-containing protein n=1 Tax=Microthlaspi erraticum TaxID=1685480 RepID=A0A6D2LHZ8_9BRAS|nr:unnamed protein product [Microthlaspi erraticum]
MGDVFRYAPIKVVVLRHAHEDFLNSISLATTLSLLTCKPPLSWNQLSFVPRCLSSHLRFFVWDDYRGSEEEKQLMRYILANSKGLKEVRITLMSSSFNLEEKEVMLKELKSMSKASFNIDSASV